MEHVLHNPVARAPRGARHRVDDLLHFVVERTCRFFRLAVIAIACDFNLMSGPRGTRRGIHAFARLASPRSARYSVRALAAAALPLPPSATPRDAPISSIPVPLLASVRSRLWHPAAPTRAYTPHRRVTRIVRVILGAYSDLPAGALFAIRFSGLISRFAKPPAAGSDRNATMTMVGQNCRHNATKRSNKFTPTIWPVMAFSA